MDPSRYADGRNIAWQLVGYDKRTERVASERPIGREQIVGLRALFDLGDDPWLVGACYPISATQWPAVIAILDCGQPDEGQDYFIESSAQP